MSAGDKLSVQITEYKNEAHVTAKGIAARTLVSAIPCAGSAILELWDGVAQSRTEERVNSLFDAMKNRLDNLDEEKVDQGFFHSEEFQSLLFLLLERLHTTHDKERLRMFGNALANSGTRDFQSDDKEQFIRVLRDLSLTDLNTLNDWRLKNWTAHVNAIDYAPEVMVSLSRLHGMGLVLEVPQQLATASLAQPIKKNFHISGFGEKFLRFVAAEAPSTEPSK